MNLHCKPDKYSIPALAFICNDIECMPISKDSHILKKDYIGNLVKWVSKDLIYTCYLYSICYSDIPSLGLATLEMPLLEL